MNSLLPFEFTKRDTRIVRLLAVLAIILFVAGCSGSDIPFSERIGLQGQPTFSLHLFRFLAVIWAALLFYAGPRWPRFSVASLFLPLGLLTAYRILGDINYLLVLVAGLLGFALLVWLYLRWPRLLTGFAAIWVLPALYLSHIYYSGSFFLNRILLIGLLVLSGLLSVARPKLGLSALSSALATFILVFALPATWSFGWIITLFLIGCLWQLVLQPRISGWEPQNCVDGKNIRGQWRSAVFTAALLTGAALLALLVTVPQINLSDSPFPERIAKLNINSPTLIFSAEDSYYLSQTPYPWALAAPRRGFLQRLVLIFTGKSHRGTIHRLRAVKDSTELANMRRAAEITSLAFQKIAPLIRPEISEAELAQIIAETFEQNGASGLAFPSIVGAGVNATLPHYSANSAVLEKGFLVVDIGCMYKNYASDMTRTFPINRRYTTAQRKLLNTVLAAADSCVARLRPGQSFRELNRLSHKVINKAGFGEYYLHSLGHSVGLNVHDPGVDTLRTGMVVTIEPGIYVPEGAEVDSIYWNLGVRVEDSYIITADSCERITHFPQVPFDSTNSSVLD